MKIIAAILVLVWGMAFAQSYRVLYSDELERVPATVTVVQGFNTLITAHDHVEVVTLGRPELLTVTRISNSIIQLNTQASDGVFGMTLVAGGRVQQFTVRIGGSLHNRTYAIQAARAAGVIPVTLGPVAPAPTPRTAVPAPAAPPAATAPAPATPPPTAAPVPPVGDWLVARVSGAPTVSGGGVFVINFSLENTSERRVSADVARLIIRQGSQERNYTLSRLPTSALIEPGAVQAGSILVQNVAPGQIELEWTLAEMGENPRTVVLRRTLNVAAAQSNK